MSLLSLVRASVGAVNVLPGSVKMISTDDLATVTAAGYIPLGITSAAQIIGLAPSDVIECLYNFNPATGSGLLAIFQPLFINGVVTLSPWNDPAITIVPTQDVHVSPEGSDITGDGTQANPYKTINHATDTITDASFNKPYAIQIGSGTYPEGALKLKPFVNLIGVAFTIVGFDSIVLDAGFFGPDFSVQVIDGILMAPAGNCTFDISTAPNGVVFSWGNVAFLNGGFTFDFIGNGMCLLNHFSVVDTGGINIYNVTNFANTLINSVTSNDTYNIINDSNIHPVNVQFNHSVVGDILIQATGAIGIQGSIVVTKPTTITLDSVAAGVVNIDNSSFYSMPVLVNAANYALIGLGNGLEANFTPVNFTCADVYNSVSGQLQGIDVALGEVANTATLIAGTVTVADTTVSANSVILVTAQDTNTTGALRIDSRIPGTSFTIASSNGADSGVVGYKLYN